MFPRWGLKHQPVLGGTALAPTSASRLGRYKTQTISAFRPEAAGQCERNPVALMWITVIQGEDDEPGCSLP